MPPVERDWLRAIRRSAGGTAVSWSGSSAGVAISAEPEADPAGVVRVAVSAPGGSSVVVGDAIGVVDSVRAAGGGATFAVPGVSGTGAVYDGGVSGRGGGGADEKWGPVLARAGVRDSIVWRPVLVVGSIGWESKFVVRALEERGWVVKTQLSIAPGTVIISPALMALDTAHYAAIVALDSSVKGEFSNVTRYVRSGGGIVAAGSAVPIVRGIGGRVAAVSDTATWRRRMHGDVAGHRTYWAGRVAEVAYVPRVELPVVGGVDPAPVAATVAAFGDPEPADAARGGRPSSRGPVSVWVFALMAAGFVGEWASRRLRGLA